MWLFCETTLPLTYTAVGLHAGAQAAAAEASPENQVAAPPATSAVTVARITDRERFIGVLSSDLGILQSLGLLTVKVKSVATLNILKSEYLTVWQR
ncbi:hypothetical protein Aca07nite_48190 [Actinoplanes capillaceus]|uniref:Uncharacterized protein n=1 Tax=Actinoplanes campanulatus TaxID=113559 RepID=A0ABQ3WMS3_9ACTN|nr:hypothetical protein Aca07nite_48190 [Actinoplanes capillaceus]